MTIINCPVTFDSIQHKRISLDFTASKSLSSKGSFNKVAERRVTAQKGNVVPRTSLLLADDNVAVLDHVCKILENNYEIVGTLYDGESVLRVWTRLKADLIVLDISMENMNGLEVARRLRNSGCKSKIVFLTVHRDPEFVRAALDAGGSAYVVKSRMWKDLAPAIEAALSGKHFVSATIGKIKPEPIQKATG